MKKKNHIQDSINEIVNNDRVTGENLQRLENFVDRFNEDSGVEDLLQQNWLQATADEKGISFNCIRDNISIEEDNFKSVVKRNGWIGVFHQVSAALITVAVLLSGWHLMNRWSKWEDVMLAEHQTIVGKTQTPIEQVVFTKGGKCYNLSQENLSLVDNGVSVVGTKKELRLNNETSQIIQSRVQEWNTLSVPNGQDYFVELSDGTKVWINSGSKLTFPNFFEKGKREVKLEGEAYFVVSSDVSNPFFIETMQSQVRVTGTQFNVCGYAEETISHVTLVEGKVDVTIGEMAHHLIPGQQLVQDNKEGKVNIKKVDVDLFTSWRNGIYEFKDVTLQEMSMRLNRWYDVEFIFSNDHAGMQRFSGMVKKEYDIEYFLKVVEKTTNVQFSKFDSQIVVTEI